MERTPEQPQCCSCFISYSHRNAEFAQRLYDRLTLKGIKCWLDDKDLRPGQDIYDGIGTGIRFWDKVVLCCSEYSLTSWWVDLEITTALEKERELSKHRGQKTQVIIPIDLDGYLRKDWVDGKAPIIRSRVAAEFSGWEDSHLFRRQFERIVQACARWTILLRCLRPVISHG